jgi:MFS transporter, OFA family, oxalate/formate antiporter
MNKKTFMVLYILLSLWMLLLGSVYMYTLYRVPLETILGMNTRLSGLPFMLSLASFSVGMFVTSQFVTIDHIKRYLYVGMSLFTTGLLLSVWMPNVFVFSLSYGVLMGLGVGAIYGIALMIVSLQDLKRQGFFSGLMLFFFGISSAILGPFASIHIENYGLESLFFIYFIVSCILFLILGIYIKFMPKYEGQSVTGIVKPWVKMFLLLTLMTLVTLTMIGLTGKIALEYYRYTPFQVSIIVSIFALSNALARPLFGVLFDKIGFKKSARISLIIVFAATLINIFNQGVNPVLFFIGYGIFWFTLGAWLAIIPLLVLKTYGVDAYTKTYGYVYLGYGLGAVIGTLLSSYMLDILKEPEYIYIFLGLVLIAAVWIIEVMFKNEKIV